VAAAQDKDSIVCPAFVSKIRVWEVSETTSEPCRMSRANHGAMLVLMAAARADLHGIPYMIY
jgi:hypothetical protein